MYTAMRRDSSATGTSDVSDAWEHDMDTDTADSEEQWSEESFLDAAQQYLSAVHRMKPLTPSEEEELLRRMKTGPDAGAARDRLVEGYQPVIISWAKRFASRCRFLTFLDLVQEGNLGVLQALDRYDERKAAETLFCTWAVWWIVGAIRAAIRQYDDAMPHSSRMLRLIQRIAKTRRELSNVLQRVPTDEEIACAARIPLTAVQEAYLAQERQVIRLSDLVSPQEEEASPLDQLDHLLAHIGPAEEENGTPTRAERVRDALSQLAPDERQVIIYRYGFLDGKTHSHSAVAERFDMSNAQVERLDRRARAQLYDLLAPFFLPRSKTNMDVA